MGKSKIQRQRQSLPTRKSTRAKNKTSAYSDEAMAVKAKEAEKVEQARKEKAKEKALNKQLQDMRGRIYDLEMTQSFYEPPEEVLARDMAREKEKRKRKSVSNDPDAGSESENEDKQPGAVKNDEPKRAKGMNYSPIEDRLLVEAYLNMTEDAINGVHQGGNVFWGKVKERFEILMERHDSTCVLIRNLASIKNRYTKRLQPSLLRFQAHYNHCKSNQESGTSEEDVIKNAIQLYEAQETGKFTLLELWKEVKGSISKFAEKNTTRAIDVEALKSPDDKNYNNLTGAMGVGLETTGSKKAKQQKKEMDAVQQATKTFNNRMDNLLEISRSIATNYAKEGTMSKFNGYMKLASYFAAKGDAEKEKEYIDMATNFLTSFEVEAPPPIRKDTAETMLLLAGGSSDDSPLNPKQLSTPIEDTSSSEKERAEKRKREELLDSDSEDELVDSQRFSVTAGVEPAEVSQETEKFLDFNPRSTSQLQRVYGKSIKDRVVNETKQSTEDPFMEALNRAKALVNEGATLSPSIGKKGNLSY